VPTFGCSGVGSRSHGYELVEHSEIGKWPRNVIVKIVGGPKQPNVGQLLFKMAKAGEVEKAVEQNMSLRMVVGERPITSITT
jgi:hypothetical protein